MANARIADVAARRRVRVRLRGAVQGVGFRPFIYDLAMRHRLAGFVKNDALGVLLEAEGVCVDAFLAQLAREAPPLAKVDAMEVETVVAAPSRDAGFEILASADGPSQTRIPADAAVCEDCLDELFDPSSRFHLYPFITCTHCGPRFTLTRRLPYDRAQTAMEPFALCPRCAAEYRNPARRRFHTEPIACADCGPSYSHGAGEIAAALTQGKIVALKGVGGFHLLCDGRDETAVAELRRRKARDAKPFAVMVANEESVAQFAVAGEAERALLRSPAHPIALLESRGGLAPSVAPNLTRVGVMLAYAPMHHLLFHAAAGAPRDAGWRRAPHPLALVATSANAGGEPLAKDNDEAHARLASIADLIITHNRDIVARVDDSVLQIVDGAPAFLRRARGFTPEPIELGDDGPCVLAAGGHMKATIAVTRGREAFVSQHIGDLSGAATLRFYHEAAQRFCEWLDVTPEAIVCDLHPEYASTRWAESHSAPLLRVQHHAAHLSAALAEARIAGPAIGLALDGHGLGDDGGGWGGELMRFDGAGWSRLAHLAPLPTPGGDRAARDCWRMGVGALAKLGRLDAAPRLFGGEPRAAQIAEMLRAGAPTPKSSSLGRLFDAAAALLGLRLHQQYEAQAAMELEALARSPRPLSGGYQICGDVIDFAPLLECLAFGGVTQREGAELLHGALIEGLSRWAAAAAAREGVAVVALGGGCFMNRILAEGIAAHLRACGLTPILARRLPANDGGLSFGQAALARAALGATAKKEAATCV